MKSDSITLLTDDAPDHVVEAEAEALRKQAFNGIASWRGQALVWTSSRAGLYDFLRIPAPVLSPDTLQAITAARSAEGTDQEAELQTKANRMFEAETGGRGTGHVRNAQIILWLASHLPKDWRAIAHDRDKFLEVVDDWIDENVSLHELNELALVTNKLLSDADSTRAVPRPKNTNPDEAGNSPSP
jgi:hypothetical protein